MIDGDSVTYFLDNRSPQISRKLSSVTGDLDITPTMAFRLKVRPRDSATTVIDAAMVPDTNLDTVSYQPIAGDFATEGVYRAWIEADFGSGVKQDTAEFEILVFAHAPGDGTRVAAVWRACRALSPVAWQALRGIPDYGDIELQRFIDLAKLRVYRSLVPPANEDALDLRVIDYIAKKVLVDNALPAAIDHWTNVLVSQSSRGNSEEVKTYPDRIRAVEGQITRFAAALDAQREEIEAVLGTAVGSQRRAPMLVGGGRSVTPNLEDLPIPGNTSIPSSPEWVGTE